MIIKNDRYLFAIDLLSGTQIKFGSTTVPLTPGRYYAHRDGTLGSTHPGFYILLINHLQTAFPGRTFDVIAQAPSIYPRKTGVRLIQLSGAAIGSLDLSGTSPIVRRLLGFDANDTSVIPWSSGKIDSPFSAYGQWMPWGCFEGRAARKDSYLDRDSEWSTAHPEVATAIIWRERKIRLVRYEYVFGVYINQDRSKYQQLAEYAQTNQDDFNNSLNNLWLVAGRNNSDFLVVYDMGEIDLFVTKHEYEIVRFADKRQTGSTDTIATRIDVAHDFWNVNMTLVVLGGNYGL